jgi:methylenetetrahydrofolate dehydrogenase (NADP+)/methenyltetrahydrofolate cyclohydrolase
MPEKFQLLDGKSVAENLYTNIKKKTDKMFSQGKARPKLVVILVGEDPASQVYVNNKIKSCEKAGVISESITYDADVSEQEVLDKIAELNRDNSVTGMIVQVPLPKHISEEKVLYAIDPAKDMDGFHPNNLGKMFLSQSGETLPPATPAGMIQMLDFYNIDVKGMNAVVIGRSNTVGKPIATMLLNRSATVTVCHSKTKDLQFYTQNADLIIAAVGIPKFVKAEMVKKGVIIIDVGIHRIDLENGEYELCGDVDFENVAPYCKAISPVPGGVGPMTVASLIENTLRASGA